MDLQYEYYKEEIKRCFLCNEWIEGKLKRQRLNNTTYYYHYDCFCKVHKNQFYKSINNSSIQKIY